LVNFIRILCLSSYTFSLAEAIDPRKIKGDAFRADFGTRNLGFSDADITYDLDKYLRY
jgi:hypothetical protein